MGAQESDSAQQEREGPHAVDIHVGGRLRQRRVGVGMTQERLARIIGITFQQVQKYERGTNRIVASRLYELARALGVTVDYFFEDMPDGEAKRFDCPATAGPELPTLMAERETLVLVRAYHRILNQDVRRRLIDLVKSLGPS
ncbi:Helix-turn-helix [Tistlia consotensis]|uniref:Helix-turn-helix n=1 Tax=Tistlia consotensis USBA 355 TaxID=560819 RepID=A0A1Y6CKH4_9PROT|nr:helix-turn-helix transcriptional regulator [Tistlia consotensis]SMF60668.1 Helix-turn-helix [Tistlia consotensis USBA 355]SNR93033.1 Helix-turn-helix [Tistlia consotensis]